MPASASFLATREENNARLLGWASLPVISCIRPQREQQESAEQTPAGCAVCFAGEGAGVGASVTGPGLDSGNDRVTKVAETLGLAGPGSIWFHAPSARLATELPRDWVAFSPISGGILADVSKP